MKLKSVMKPRTPLVESGSYLAVCVGVLAIGEQYVDRSAFGGRSDYESQVTFVFELPTEVGEDGKAKQLSKDLNAVSSLNGTLNKWLSSWNIRNYTRDQLEEADLCEQLGKACSITVEVSESGFSRVTGVSAIPKGIPIPSTNTPFITFNVEAWDDAAFAALPEWAQNKVKNSTQYQKEHVPQTDVTVQPNPAMPQAAAQTMSPEMLAFMQQQMAQNSVAPANNPTNAGGAPF